MDRAYALLNVRTVVEKPNEWVIEGVASTPTADRMSDIVEPLGAKFALPMPLLWQHDTQKPVGRVEFAKPTTKGIPYVAHLPKVAEAGTLKDRIDEAVQSIKYRLVAAVSIGFRALENGVEVMKDGGLRFKAWEWLELSLVTIPANSEATITSIKSLDFATLAASGRSEVLPGASGSAANRGNSTNRSKGNVMKTLQELCEMRTTKTARLTELIERKKAEDRAFSDEEGVEFDTLTDEVKGLKDDIRVAGYHSMNSANAKSVDGSNAENGSRSRGGMGFVRKTDPEDVFKGQGFTRFLIAKAAAFIAAKDGNYTSAAEIAKDRWGATHPNLVQRIKTAVAGGGTGTGEWGAELAQSDTRFSGDFVDYLYGQTLFDRLPLRSMPARVHVKGSDGAATAYWVGESKAIPVTAPSASDVELLPHKVGAIAVCSKELVADSSPAAEMWIRDSITQASAQRVDTTFLSALAAVAGVSPAGILNGVTGIAASGTDAAAIRADIMALYGSFLSGLYFSDIMLLMKPATAKAMSLLVNSLGQTEFSKLTAKGGELLGDPVMTGDNITSGNIIAISPSNVWKIGDGGVDFSMSDTAMVEQNDAPTGATDTPVAASATLVSLWQEESIGFKVVRRVSWAKRRAGAVAFITDAEYGGVVS